MGDRPGDETDRELSVNPRGNMSLRSPVPYLLSPSTLPHPSSPVPAKAFPMRWKAPNLVSLIITTVIATSFQMLTLHYVLTFSLSSQVHKVGINNILHKRKLRLRKAN